METVIPQLFCDPTGIPGGVSSIEYDLENVMKHTPNEKIVLLVRDPETIPVLRAYLMVHGSSIQVELYNPNISYHACIKHEGIFYSNLVEVVDEHP